MRYNICYFWNWWTTTPPIETAGWGGGRLMLLSSRQNCNDGNHYHDNGRYWHGVCTGGVPVVQGGNRLTLGLRIIEFYPYTAPYLQHPYYL